VQSHDLTHTLVQAQYFGTSTVEKSENEVYVCKTLTPKRQLFEPSEKAII
jgi:hypothetical protein